MEGFFCVLSKFFAEGKNTADGEGCHIPQKIQKISDEVPRLQDPAAEKEEISRRPAGDRQDHVNPHLAALGGDGMPEEGGGNRHPEEKIQESAQKT